MKRVKRLWWNLRAEGKVLVLWASSIIPGAVGTRVRAACLRRFLKRLGDSNVFQLGFRITNPEKVSIGSHCNFAQGTYICGGGGVQIGDWVGFGPDVKVWSVNHRFDDPTRPWMLQGWERKPVVIEDDVWLGANVFVMPGVTIGRGSVVSACSVLAKSVPPYALVAGNPGRVIGWRKHPDDNAAQDSRDVPPA